MEFIFHYLWPSLKVCFKTIFKWIVIAGAAFLQFAAVVSLVSATPWLGVGLTLVFFAIDGAIIRAYCDYTEDQERIENGWLPKNRDK